MKIELNDDGVRYVLNALAKCPWGEVDNLIRSIAGQADQHAKAQQAASVPPDRPRDADDVPVGGTD